MKVIGSAGRPENWPLAEQPCGEFAPAVSTMRAGDALFQTHAQFADICLDPFFRPKSFQSGTTSLQQIQFQAEPHRRSGQSGQAKASRRFKITPHNGYGLTTTNPSNNMGIGGVTPAQKLKVAASILQNAPR